MGSAPISPKLSLGAPPLHEYPTLGRPIQYSVDAPRGALYEWVGTARSPDASPAGRFLHARVEERRLSINLPPAVKPWRFAPPEGLRGLTALPPTGGGRGHFTLADRSQHLLLGTCPLAKGCGLELETVHSRVPNEVTINGATVRQPESVPYVPLQTSRSLPSSITYPRVRNFAPALETTSPQPSSQVAHLFY